METSDLFFILTCALFWIWVINSSDLIFSTRDRYLECVSQDQALYAFSFISFVKIFFIPPPRFRSKSFMLQGCIAVVLTPNFEGKPNTEAVLMFSFKSEDYAVIQYSYTAHEILNLLYTVSSFLFSLCKNSILASLLLYRRWKKIQQV